MMTGTHSDTPCQYVEEILDWLFFYLTSFRTFVAANLVNESLINRQAFFSRMDFRTV